MSTNDEQDHGPRGYTVEPTRSQPGRFRWLRATASDGVTVPAHDVSEVTFTTQAEARPPARVDCEIDRLRTGKRTHRGRARRLFRGEAPARPRHDCLALAVPPSGAAWPAFLTNDGRPLTLTTRRTGSGNMSRSCESLTRVIRKLHDQAGIEAAGARPPPGARSPCASAARATIFDIREVLGRSTLSETKNLVEGEPVDLGRIVASVI